MPDLPVYPDAELVMLDLLSAVTGAGTTVTHTDDDLAAPCVQVQRVGGAEDGVTDHALIQIACYGTTRMAAWALSGAVQQRVLAASGGGVTVTGSYVTGVTIDHTTTVLSGRQMPYENPNLRMVVSDYRVDLRRLF